MAEAPAQAPERTPILNATIDENDSHASGGLEPQEYDPAEAK
jgi:hypothetical protein